MSSAHPSTRAFKLSPGTKIGIVRSVWHTELTKKMQEDAVDVLLDAGLEKKNLFLLTAPGSFEIPLLCKELIDVHELSGIIAFGIIVQGETHHAQLIADASTQGLMNVQLQTSVPIIDEILYVDYIDIAKDRVHGEHGKGRLAARTLLHSLALLDEIHS